MAKINDFGITMGYKTNDELVAINGEEINMETVEKQIASLKKKTLPGEKVEVTVARMEKGKSKLKKLKAKAILVEKKQRFLVQFNDEATEKQLMLRKAWLGQE